LLVLEEDIKSCCRHLRFGNFAVDLLQVSPRACNVALFLADFVTALDWLQRWTGTRPAYPTDEKTLVLLGRFSGNPDVEKARVEFERAQENEEAFHNDFDGMDFTIYSRTTPFACSSVRSP
jgi:hypothetical protein